MEENPTNIVQPRMEECIGAKLLHTSLTGQSAWHISFLLY